MAARPHVVLAGDDQGRDGFAREVDALIAARGLAGRVTRAGHIADMAAAYAVADVVVSASLDPEPFGRTTVEDRPWRARSWRPIMAGRANRW